jgi:hypothetical protein
LLNNFFRPWNNKKGDALAAFKREETAMARSARKPEREKDESAKQASKKVDKTVSTPAAADEGSAATASEATTSAKPTTELAGFQSDQFELLRAVLEKRSEASASPRAIAEEFATLWLPAHAVDLELLVPELRQAGVPESLSYAARACHTPRASEKIS